MDNGSTKGSFVIDIHVKDFLHLDIFPNPNKKYMYVDGSRSIGDGVLFFFTQASNYLALIILCRPFFFNSFLSTVKKTATSKKNTP